LFERAYCQMAICMTSRASLMSGYRPINSKMYQRNAMFDHVPDVLSLNQHFLNNGYETANLLPVASEIGVLREGVVAHHGDHVFLAMAQVAVQRRAEREKSVFGKRHRFAVAVDFGHLAGVWSAMRHQDDINTVVLRVKAIRSCLLGNRNLQSSQRVRWGDMGKKNRGC
jgi:hypothetical protein